MAAISSAVVVGQTPIRPRKCIRLRAVRSVNVVLRWPACRGAV